MIVLGSAPFLVFALRHPLLDELLDECGRQRLVQRKVDRSFGGGETFQFLLKCADDRGSGEQTAVVRKRGKPHQHYSVSKGRNSITNDLGSFRRDSGPNAARILSNALRAGSGTRARYSLTFFGAPLPLAGERRLPDLVFFTQAMLRETPLPVHASGPPLNASHGASRYGAH